MAGSQYHPRQGKMGGVTHARVENLGTGTLRDDSLRSELKHEEVAIQRQTLGFLSTDGGHCCLMNPDTFEQTEIATGNLAPHARILFAGMQAAVEFLGGRAVNVVFPDMLELKATDTAPPIDQQADRNFTSTKLENGIEGLVPQFVETGDVNRFEVEALKYTERAEARARAT